MANGANEPLAPPLDALVRGRDPLRLELRPEHLPLRQAILTLLGIATLLLFIAATAGWLGAVPIARDGYGVLGTVFALAIGAAALAAGQVPRRLRVSLTFQPDRLVVASRLARWSWSRELVRDRTRGAVVETLETGGGGELSRYGCWLAVLAEPPAKPLRVGRGMGLDPARLEAIAELIDRWRDG